MNAEDFAKLAPIIAEEKANELEMKNGLMQKREDYLKTEEEKVRQELVDQWNGYEQKLDSVGDILKAETESLPEEEKQRIEEENKKVEEKMQSVSEEEMVSDKPLQEILGISNETLLWVYQVGKKRMEAGSSGDAIFLFSYLAYLNPKVADYWLVLGLALKAHNLQEESLYAFSFAAILNEENVQVRYQLATTYLHLGKFDDAEIEVGVLQELINEQNLQEFQPVCDELKTQVQNRNAA